MRARNRSGRFNIPTAGLSPPVSLAPPTGRARLQRVCIAGCLAAIACLAMVRPAASAESPTLPLAVVWPPEGTTVDGDQVRVGGRTDPAATIAVNGKTLHVYPTGAFAGTAALKPGANKIVFRATMGEQTASRTRTVKRRPPLKTLPRSPIRFDPAVQGEPSEDMVVRPGDTIRVRVKGSPGAKATFRIGEGGTHYPLFPVASKGVKGFYEGVYEVKPTDRFTRARVTCYLGPQGKSRASARRQLMPAKITVRTAPFPETGRVAEDYGRLRAEPNHGAPLAAAPKGTLLNIDGRVGDSLRVALTPWLHGWLGKDQVDLVTDAAPLQRGVVRNLMIQDEEPHTVVRIALGHRVPFAVTPRSDPPTLELTLFGVENKLNWVTDRAPQGAVKAVSPIPANDATCKLHIDLRGALFGYRADYDETTFCLTVRKPPAVPTDPKRPLAGRTILLDPGHGGPSYGTVGSTGLEEKMVNADLCEILYRRLQQRGATVRLTRSGDADVSLADRARRAQQGGDLFVSVHNNSVSLDADPLAARGVGVFYYHPHSRDVAQAIYQRMQCVEPRPDPYGLVQADFFVCREITSMPSVLIECLFLSHPEDEMLLLDTAFNERNMEAVAAGITDWFGRAGRAAGAE